MSSKDNVKVIIRARPKDFDSNVLICDGSNNQVVLTPPQVDDFHKVPPREMKNREQTVQRILSHHFKKNSFCYDEVFSPQTEQSEIYENVGKVLLQHLNDGFNSCLFAYGQTGSGKTYTMFGDMDEPSNDEELLDDDESESEVHEKEDKRGIIPRFCEELFQSIEEQKTCESEEEKEEKEVHFKIEISMVEIYNERCKDLFTNETDLEIRERKKNDFFIPELSRKEVFNSTEILHWIDIGNSHRTKAKTLMNHVSSRAHTLFQIHCTKIETIKISSSSSSSSSSGSSYDVKTLSVVNMIDLAGSEQMNTALMSSNEKEFKDYHLRKKELIEINKSLSSLGRCIKCLYESKTMVTTTSEENKKQQHHIPYRDSKLTKLIANSLGGNSKTIMIATLSPDPFHFEQTLQTCRFANRVKMIQNKPIMNIDPKEQFIKQLKMKIIQLQIQLNLKKNMKTNIKREREHSDDENDENDEEENQDNNDLLYLNEIEINLKQEQSEQKEKQNNKNNINKFKVLYEKEKQKNKSLIEKFQEMEKKFKKKIQKLKTENLKLSTKIIMKAAANSSSSKMNKKRSKKQQKNKHQKSSSRKETTNPQTTTTTKTTLMTITTKTTKRRNKSVSPRNHYHKRREDNEEQHKTTKKNGKRRNKRRKTIIPTSSSSSCVSPPLFPLQRGRGHHQHRRRPVTASSSSSSSSASYHPSIENKSYLKKTVSSKNKTTPRKEFNNHKGVILCSSFGGGIQVNLMNNHINNNKNEQSTSTTTTTTTKRRRRNDSSSPPKHSSSSHHQKKKMSGNKKSSSSRQNYSRPWLINTKYDNSNKNSNEEKGITKKRSVHLLKGKTTTKNSSSSKAKSSSSSAITSVITTTATTPSESRRMTLQERRNEKKKLQQEKIPETKISIIFKKLKRFFWD